MSDWKDLMKAYLKVDKKYVENTVQPNSAIKFTEQYLFSDKNKEKVEDTEFAGPSHMDMEEEYAKFVEEHMVEEPEQIIETEQDAYEAAVTGGYPIEFQETVETHLDNGPTSRPVEEPEFTVEELEAFKALNADKFVHETNNNNLISDVEVVEPTPIETKVKSVKVSKPKTPKAVTTPKKPSKPKTKK